MSDLLPQEQTGVRSVGSSWVRTAADSHVWGCTSLTSGASCSQGMAVPGTHRERRLFRARVWACWRPSTPGPQGRPDPQHLHVTPHRAPRAPTP